MRLFFLFFGQHIFGRICCVLTCFYFFMLCSAVCAFDVWFVDTRRGFEINQLDNNSKWNRSTLNEFQQSHNPNIPLVIVTHGYKMTYDEAKQFGINFSKLTHNFGEHRFLFWSWDAEKENCGIKSDAINTGKKADAESKYLTNFLKQLKPQSKVSLIGFSYGARLISAAIQNLATEQLQQLKQNTNNKNKITTNLNIRIVFLAAAVDQDQFEQNKKYGNLLQITDKLLVNINAADPALLLYPLLTGIKSPKAAGRYGINTTKIHPKLASKIKSLNVRPDIGIDHTFISSFCAFLKYKNEVKKYALFNDAAK